MFFILQEINTKRSPNATKLHGDFFWTRRHIMDPGCAWGVLRGVQPTRARQKTQKYLAAFYSYSFYLAFDLSIYYNFIHVRLPILSPVTRKGLTTPLTCRVASSCYLCAGVVYVVLLGSPTGSITLVSSLREIPTVAVLHHPFLFGETPT